MEILGAISMDLRRCGLLMVLVLVIGCRAKQPASAEQMAGRLDAATAMSNVSQRNDALAAVALDAADAGEGGIVKRAVGQISNVSQQNDVAYSCALKLAERGKSQEATAIAKMISNVSKQNEALRRIAEGG
jgi:thioredoxin-like negative regulator of GroEL